MRVFKRQLGDAKFELGSSGSNLTGADRVARVKTNLSKQRQVNF